MPDLLLELFSEEIPARMQARAAEDLKKLVTDRLVAAGLVYEGAQAFATPRRLALAVQGIPVRQPDLKEERKGPRVGAPEDAIAGFLNAAGLASIERGQGPEGPEEGRLLRRGDREAGPAGDRGDRRACSRSCCAPFPWPKSMRWGAQSAKSSSLELGAAAAFHRRDVRARRPKSPTSCRLRSTALSSRQHHLRPSLPGARPRSR